MLGFNFYGAAGTAAAAGIFIPIAALGGLSAAELGIAVPAAEKTGKTVLAILEGFNSYLSNTTTPKLGFTASKGNPAGTGVNRITQNYTFTSQILANAKSGLVTTLPVPFSTVGKFSFADVFPGSTSVASGDAVGVGVLIPTASLTPYRALNSADTTISGTSDNRWLVDALLGHLSKERDLRAATIPSAIINSSLSNFAASPIPASFTVANSGIDFLEVDSLSILQRSYSLTLELELNQSTQTFDVRTATA
jgi:hypothetical protein